MKLVADFQLKAPFRLAVIGGSATGKTEFITRLLEERKIIINQKIKKIYWFYKYKQNAYEQLAGKLLSPVSAGISSSSTGLNSETEIQFVYGLPNSNFCVGEQLFPLGNDDENGIDEEEGNAVLKPANSLHEKFHYVFIFDDLDLECFENRAILALFTGGSHHYNISLILSSQNILQRAKHQVTISRNLTHMILMADARGKASQKWLGLQVNPSDPRELLRVYQCATASHPYSYLVVDFSPQARFQYYNGIFPGEKLAVFI